VNDAHGQRRRQRTPSLTADGAYVAEIDGMRALSIMVVAASHFWPRGPIPGGFGVTVFFFVSGFLITRLLIAEHAKSGRISIPRFYVRRFLRLYPALIALLIGASAASFLAQGSVPLDELAAGAFYYMNYFSLDHPQMDLPIRMLWSLAIEEHYYLLYPLAFAALSSNRVQFIAVLAAIAVFVLLWCPVSATVKQVEVFH
jgi:peptidoglycan/LPS O-acetylase OafA/YrhL